MREIFEKYLTFKDNLHLTPIILWVNMCFGTITIFSEIQTFSQWQEIVLIVFGVLLLSCQFVIVSSILERKIGGKKLLFIIISSGLSVRIVISFFINELININIAATSVVLWMILILNKQLLCAEQTKRRKEMIIGITSLAIYYLMSYLFIDTSTPYSFLVCAIAGALIGFMFRLTLMYPNKKIMEILFNVAMIFMVIGCYIFILPQIP